MTVEYSKLKDNKVSHRKNKIITDYNEFLKFLWLEFGHPEDIKQVKLEVMK